MGSWQIGLKYIWAMLGGIIAMFEPLTAFIYVCFLAVVFDCFSAYRLSVRIKHKFGRSKGKFQSNHAKRMLKTFTEIGGLLVLAFLIDKVILEFDELWLTKIVSGIFCFLQIWSILENASSESDSKWLKPLQRILVNKAERHFDIDLDDFKDKEDNRHRDNHNNN